MIVRSTNCVEKFNRWASLQKEVYLDIETTGLNPRKDEIIGIAVHAGDQSFYLAHQEFKYEKLRTLLTKEQLAGAMKQLAICKLITFNGAFDLPFIKHYLGVDLLDSLWCDVLLLKHTVDEEFPFRLKDIAKKLFGENATKEQEEMSKSVKNNGGSYPSEMYKADLGIMAKYAIKDVELTRRVLEFYMPKLEQQGLSQFFFQDEVMPLYKEVTIPMEQGGIPVDVKALQDSLVEINEDIQDLEDKIQEAIKPDLGNFMTWYVNRHYPVSRTGTFAQAVVDYYKLGLPKTRSGKYSLSAKALDAVPDCEAKSFFTEKSPLPLRDVYEIQSRLVEAEEQKYPFNLSSKHHLKKLFFEQLGEKAVSFTELGNPQVDDSFLDLMAEKYEWVSWLRDYNKLVKIRGAYIERFLEGQEDGVFYPSFFQHRTVSGRYGSNLQQLSRPLEEGQASPLVLKHNNRIRKYFIAGEGHVFIDADQESLEPRVFAHVSGDERLRDIFRSGNDFYSTIAIQTEKIEGVSANKMADNYLGKVNKPKRQMAKAYCFTKDTLISMSDGLKPIHMIKVGDLVTTKNGVSKKVTKTFKRVAPVIKVHTNRGTLECTKDHKIFANNMWVEASMLKKGDKLIENFFPKHVVTSTPLPIFSNFKFKNGGNKPIGYLDIDSDWAYFVGAMLGDGIIHISKKDSRYGHGLKGYVGICGIDNDGVVDWVESFLSSLGYKMRLVESRDTKNGEIFLTKITSNSELCKLVYDTLKIGDMRADKKCKNLKIPDYIINATESQKLSFVAGLLDTDGYIKDNHGHSNINICSKDTRLTTGLIVLLRSLGVEASYVTSWNKTYKRFYFIVSITRSGANKLAHLGLHNYMKCKRKADSVEKCINYIPKYKKSKIKKAQVIGIEDFNEDKEVFDITVEDEHNFYANGILVHNCLGIPYGMSAYKLQFEIGVTQEEAQRLIDQYLDAFPDLKQWMHESKEQAMVYGAVRSEAGRIRHMPEAKRLAAEYGENLLDSLWVWKQFHDNPAMYEKVKKKRKKFVNYINNARNFQIQSLATSVVNRAAISIMRYMRQNGIPGYVCAQIHDQLVVRTLAEYGARMQGAVQEIMENNYKLSVPLKAPASLAKDLYEGH